MPRASERLQQLQAKIGARTGVRAAVGDNQGGGDTSTHAELWLYGVVGGYWFGFNAKTVGDQLRGLEVDRLTVRIHSPGGSVFEGIAIANLLRNHKANVTVVIDGLAASAASIIAIAGDDVVMSPGSQMMIHDAWTCVCGNEKELRQEADWIGKQSVNLAEQYALRTGGTAESWRALMTAEPDGTWYTAQEAVDAKLADRIGTVVAASPAPEPPADPFEEEDDDLEASAAYALDTLLLHPAALAAWQPSGTHKPPTAPADGSTHTEGGSAVAFSDEQMTTLRSTLGLAEDADESAILAALEDVVDKATEPNAGGSSTPQIPEGMTLIETGVLDELKAGASAGQAANKELAAQKRDRAIQAAIADGKITPARQEHYAKLWDTDPEGTEQLLNALEAGLIPVEAKGHAQGGDAENLAADADYYALFPDERPAEQKGA
jgi:ATP-dependent protease ClpP protease subunit